MSRVSVLSVAVAAAMIIGTGAGHAQAPAWQPSRNVEIVAGSAAGGAQDRTARSLQRLLTDKGIVPTSVSVSNKPGGGGAVAMTFLNQHPGDAHYITVGSPTLLTNQINLRGAGAKVDYTPIAILFSEYIVLAVRPDSGITSGRELAQRLKANPGGVSFGVATARGGMQHVAVGLVARAAGADVKKLKVVVFNSGGESITATLGGHIDVVATAAANAAPHVESGKLRVVGVAAPRRLPAPFSSVPTWREQGMDAVASNWRSVLGPRALTEAQLGFWDAAFTRLAAASEWQDEMRRNHWAGEHLKSREAAAYMDAQSKELKSVLGDLLGQ